MAKKVAVVVPNPVNGFGLFAYLENFYEKGVEYKTFAVNDTKSVKTNSGLDLTLDGVIGDLKGHESDFDGIVFACGDAIITLKDNIEKPYYSDMFQVFQNFNNLGKLIAGHCAAGMIFEKAGITEGKKLALHPYAKSGIKAGIATDNTSIIDKNLFTAKDEDYVLEIIPYFINFL